MSTAFAYKARDPQGSLHEGQIEAASAEDAGQQLRRDGFTVLEINEDLSPPPSLFPRRVTRAEVVYASTQLAVMIDTGIALAEALESMAAQEENPTLKRVLLELHDSVQQGEDFSLALAKHPKLFDKTYVSLIKASEATGTMGPMLERIATYLRKELESRARVRAALAYPMVMLVLAVMVTIFLLTYVMPQFAPMFASRGTKLPLPTKVMMAASNVLVNQWYWCLLGTTVVVGGLIYGLRTEAGKKVWDGIKIRAPLLGTMSRKVAIGRSIRTLGTMMGSGIPVLDALKLSADVAGNWYYEQLWKHVSDQVVEGQQIHESLAGQPLFPQMLVQMISAGERTGRLGQVLERVSDFYEQEVETSLKGLTAMLEPIMITVMGGVVGTIGMAIMLPIFSLSKPAG
ncbi:MAG: type II secretion system F family protein [Planctomycetes bacterium]|nr:type II secretion system F family protein [Planctomycetota bacterium]